MYLTRCPTCGERSATAEIGQVMACPRCPATYTATVNEADNTREAFVGYVRGKIQRAGEALVGSGVGGILCAGLPLTLLGVQTATAHEDIGGSHGALLLALITLLCALLLSVVVVYGGIQIQRMRQYPLCVLAAILSMLPFANLCCITGLLVGPNVLSYLMQPEVRKAFALNRGEE